MEFREKFVFHIPHHRWDEELGLLDIPWESFLRELTEHLAALGLPNSYVLPATGHYKGRTYPEDLLVLYCAPEQGEGVLDAFRALCRRRGREMGQESYAVERGNTLTILTP